MSYGLYGNLSGVINHVSFNACKHEDKLKIRRVLLKCKHENLTHYVVSSANGTISLVTDYNVAMLLVDKYNMVAWAVWYDGYFWNVIKQ